MKHKHLYTLLDQTFTTVQVAFNTDRALARKRTLEQRSKLANDRSDADEMMAYDNIYTYKAPKSWNLAAGAIVLLYGAGERLTLATVVHVDSTPNIDPDADFTYKWLVQPVDFREHTHLVEAETAFSATMLEVERAKQREQLVNSFRDSLPEGSEALKLFEQATATIIDQKDT